ncbi:MAG: radical SAM protein, partial [Rhodospirillales bacterium]
PKVIMDDGLFVKMTQEIGRFKDYVEKVMLYLDGEPLLDKKLAQRVRLMKEAGVKRVNIASNASLLDESRARALLEAGLDEIYITLDSLKPEVYEKIRVRLKFDQVYGNIRKFIELRNELRHDFLIRIQMIQQELNYDEADDFRGHWSKWLSAHDQIVVQKAHNWAHGAEVMHFGDERDVNNIPCIAIWGTFVVHADGTVPLCCMDTDTVHRLGDLRSQSIEEVWNGESLADIRRQHLAGNRQAIGLCDGCTLWRDEKHFQKSDRA